MELQKAVLCVPTQQCSECSKPPQQRRIRGSSASKAAPLVLFPWSVGNPSIRQHNTTEKFQYLNTADVSHIGFHSIQFLSLIFVCIIEMEIFVDPNSTKSNIELGTYEYPFRVSLSILSLSLDNWRSLSRAVQQSGLLYAPRRLSDCRDNFPKVWRDSQHLLNADALASRKHRCSAYVSSLLFICK